MSLQAGDATNKSTQSFVTALVSGLTVAGIEVAVFMLIRNQFRKVYNPRSYLVPPAQRHDPLPTGLLSWIPYILRMDQKQIIAKNGLDAWAVTWLILLPVDAANSRGVNTGLDRFTFGNVGLSQSPRYAAHLIIVWILTFYVFYIIRRELSTYVILRQEWLISKQHAQFARSKTVLVTGVPKQFLSEEALTKYCNIFPGGVKRVWVARNLKKMPDLYERRRKACSKLESAETKLLKTAAKAISANDKTAQKAAKKGDNYRPPEPFLSELVPAAKRPKHKLGFLGLVGEKVDTIDWARKEIATTTEQLEAARRELKSEEGQHAYPPESAAFIQFNYQIAAHMFAQLLAHHTPLRMSAKYIEVDREDVIWGNLSLNPMNSTIRYAASWGATLGLILLWSFPVAFVGSLSNISSLCISTPWLRWLCQLPTPLNGIIQGALPPVALAVLFILLPIILRIFARIEGIPLRTQIELSLMTRYFLILVIHGFLVVTLASGLVKSLPLLSKNPGSAVTILATQLPAASTFFLTAQVTTGIAGAAGGLLQIATLAIYYIKLFLLGSTPRSVFGVRYSMSTVEWGTLFPSTTLLTVIGLTYSIISPLITGFAFLTFFLYWFLYKYLFLLVIDTPKESETGGLFYPKAITHIFVGLYLEEVCLTGLFFLARDIDGKAIAIPQGALMIVLIIFTVLFHVTMSWGFDPLIAYLPISLAAKIAETQGYIDDDSEQGSSTHLSPPGEKEKEQREATFPPSVPSQKPEETEIPVREGTIAGDEHLDVNAFNHPATYEGYNTVWLPQDEAGFYRDEIEATQAAGVDVSCEGASMNQKGHVEVVRAPPGEDWDETQAVK